MRIIGMISGTSHDGIDVAVVDFADDGGRLTGRVLHTGSTPYSVGLRERLLAALPPAPTTLAEICELDTLIGQAFADAAAKASEAVGGVDAVCSHGQTVYHWVDGARALGTLQIGQPAWIAERLGVPVIADTRARDIAAGGHGAPLVSFLDALLLGARETPSAAVNLGGIANVTLVDPRGESIAYDIGPSNALIDAVVVEHGLNPMGYDEGGRIAASGRVNETLLRSLLDDPYYRQPAPKSTGKEHFNGAYVRAALARVDDSPSAADLVATLTELTVRTVAHELARTGVDHAIVSGGGCRNPMLLDGIRSAVPQVRIALSDDLGAPADDKEAIAFALIGWATMHGVPATIPSATGARGARVLGAIVPGDGPLRLPEPVAGIRSLVLVPPTAP